MTMPRRMTAEVKGKKWRKIKKIRGNKKAFPRSRPRNRAATRGSSRQKREIKGLAQGAPGEILEAGTVRVMNGRAHTLLRKVVLDTEGLALAHFRLSKHC